ncbi:hypothetical protein GCM10009850_028990 [Nonomuraea monospora]|uniref:DUF4760 domain-containing protein n=1 Tax=Nonomuraea monospora TaxID=568818 RepID=A0ABN3CDV5_9ACTN
MDIPLALSIAGALAAVAAVVISIRQARASARQALMPVVLGTFQEARSPEWFEARDYIFERLAAEHSPERGISGLPEPARTAVRKVGFLFDNAGLLIVHKAVPEELILSFFGESLPKFWQIMEPFVRRESEIRQVKTMVFFEHLVARSRMRPAGDLRRRLGLLSADP